MFSGFLKVSYTSIWRYKHWAPSQIFLTIPSFSWLASYLGWVALPHHSMWHLAFQASAEKLGDETFKLDWVSAPCNGKVWAILLHIFLPPCSLCLLLQSIPQAQHAFDIVWLTAQLVLFRTLAGFVPLLSAVSGCWNDLWVEQSEVAPELACRRPQRPPWWSFFWREVTWLVP